MRLSVLEVPNQKAALAEMVRLVEESSVDPLVRNAALAITHDCDDRDDNCEIEAIYNAVKHGDERVKGLERGLKYQSDPRWADFFTKPTRMLRQIADGYGAGDCDDHSMLVAALLSTLGFIVGFCAWGRKKGEYTHVFSVVAVPKNADPGDGTAGFGSAGGPEWVALDTTVDEAEVGWRPEGGHFCIAYADGT